MKRTSTTNTLLAGAAIAGLLGGSFAAKATAATVKPTKSSIAAAGVLADDKKGETHDCAGKNTCKGKGGCKSGDAGCAGKNTCKGKGGCGSTKGKNDCKGKGECRTDGKPMEKEGDKK